MGKPRVWGLNMTPYNLPQVVRQVKCVDKVWGFKGCNNPMFRFHFTSYHDFMLGGV